LLTRARRRFDVRVRFRYNTFAGRVIDSRAGRMSPAARLAASKRILAQEDL
jgi:hypothetical protein